MENIAEEKYPKKVKEIIENNKEFDKREKILDVIKDEQIRIKSSRNRLKSRTSTSKKPRGDYLTPTDRLDRSERLDKPETTFITNFKEKGKLYKN